MSDRGIDFLMEAGGTAVRTRTARELLCMPSNVETARTQTELSQTALARRWLARLQPRFNPGDLHGSKPECFENTLGKLVTMGLRAGDPALDVRAALFQARLDGPDPYPFAFYRSLVAGFLLMAGYSGPSILAEVRRRLERTSAFARQGWRELYIDPAPYPDIPIAFRSHRLVDPAFYPQGDSLYPLIYDLFAFAALWPSASQAERDQIDAVAAYVLLPEYQQIDDGYGIMRAGPRRYYSIGWDCKLPGYAGIDPSRLSGSFVQRLVLMSVFPAARAHPWFQNGLAHLERFASGRGTWIFPRAYLPEKPAGYWVGGAYLGLEENRRSERAIEIESTFWMAQLRYTA